MSFLTSVTPPKWFCILYSSATSETLGCTPWMDTLNRLNALHLNATLLPRIVISYVRKSCAACSLSNLISMNLLDRDIILYVAVSLTVPNSGEHLHFLYQIFSSCLFHKNYTLDPSSWVQNQGLLCKAGFFTAPLLCSGLVVYLLSLNLV